MTDLLFSFREERDMDVSLKCCESNQHVTGICLMFLSGPGLHLWALSTPALNIAYIITMLPVRGLCVAVCMCTG
jgi:hypothetical protein